MPDPIPAAQTHLWLLGERTNRCGLDPLGDHHTHQPDEVTCFACRALLAEDREDMKSAALVTAQRALRETQAERDALQLVGRKLRMELFNALAKSETQAARIAELEKEKARLLEAANLAAAWMWDPDESPGEQFDRIAEWFYRETGVLRPGKSEPFECARSPHERQAAWVAWSTEKNRAARAALTALRDAIAEAEVGP